MSLSVTDLHCPLDGGCRAGEPDPSLAPKPNATTAPVPARPARCRTLWLLRSPGCDPAFGGAGRVPIVAVLHAEAVTGSRRRKRVPAVADAGAVRGRMRRWIPRRS